MAQKADTTFEQSRKNKEKVEEIETAVKDVEKETTKKRTSKKVK